jgi:arylsulfatase A-like enzyme
MTTAALIALAMLTACTDQSPAPTSEEAAPTGEEAAPARPPDVLLVVMDTVRADALSPYGSARSTSPQFDAIADAGVLFEDVTTIGTWTWPGHASLFTGRPPWIHGAHFALPDAGGMQVGPDPFHARAMADELPTLADRYKAAGYRTVSLSANRLISWDFGLARGFEDARTFTGDEDVVQSARALLAHPDDRPLFLFVNLYGAHAPFHVEAVNWLADDQAALDPATAPPWLKPWLLDEPRAINLFRAPDDGGRIGIFGYMQGDFSIPEEGLALLREVYDGEVLKVDFRLHEVLEAWNAARGTGGVVAVTADHGEFLGERGLMEHGRVVYPEVARVPMVISGPGLPRGERVSHPVQLHDLYPTLLELSGIPADQAEGIGEARSLVPVVEGPQRPRPIVSTAWRDHFWAQEGGARFEQGYRSWREGDDAIVFGEDSGLEYYRLQDDPGMLHDRAVEFPERAAELRRNAEPTLHPSVETGTIEMDPAAAEQLRALGYVK